MITDNQVRKLKKYLNLGKTLEISAARSGMDEKTARKYRDVDKLPSEIRAGRNRDWCTREDPFEEVWDIVTHVPHLGYSYFGFFRHQFIRVGQPPINSMHSGIVFAHQ